MRERCQALNDFFMVRTICLLLVITASFCSAITRSQNVVTSREWRTISVCELTFRVPVFLKDQKARGIDSCVAVLNDEEMGLSLDYGLYSGVSKYDHYIDFKEKEIVIDGKKGTIATFRYSTMDPEHSWVARIFVNVEPPKDGWGSVALNMFVVVKDPGEFANAEKIFRSIKFRKYPRPNP